MTINTNSLYTLSKFELVEMVRDFYREEREKTKYLNLRTKKQLILMMEERLTYQPPPRPLPPPPIMYSAPTPSDGFIQSKYGSFLRRLHEKEEDTKKSKSS